MKNKLRVAVVMGGRSPEYEVSIKSGEEIVKSLDKKRYVPIPVVVGKQGELEDLLKIIKLQIDITFIAMHGEHTEDGSIQGFLDLIGMPYTGSGILSSAIGMDKLFSRSIFSNIGLNIPKYEVVKRSQQTTKVTHKLKLPLFVHPNNQGSAIGANIVRKENDFIRAVKKAHQYSTIALVDEYINGTEVSCAILGNDQPKALPLVEIRPKNEFFDYEAKYNPKFVDEIVPAQIPVSLTKITQHVALNAYKSINCRAFGRVDMIIKNNKVYILEVNTIPGLTPVSLFPKAAKSAGINYSNMLDKIINFSIKNDQ